MGIFRFVGLLAIPAILVAGCQEKRVLGTERSGPTSSKMRAVDQAKVVIDRAPDPTSGEDLGGVPELREPIWAPEASRARDVESNAPAGDLEHDPCATSPGGQEREEAEQAPR